MRKNIVLLLLLLLPILLSSFTQNNRGQMPSHVLITEILYDAPNSDATEEWIELFNPATQSVSLNGWRLTDNAGSFSISGTIAAGGYITISRDNTAFQNLYGYPANLTGSSLALGNSGDVVTLLDDFNNVIDMVAWENEIAGWDVSAGDGHTIRRISNIDTDTVSDWEDSNTGGDPGLGPYSTVAPDNISPIVSIDNIGNDTIVEGTVQIQVTATDLNGISQYEILIDNQLRATDNFYNWNTLTEDDGAHTLIARARDPSGNWGQILLAVLVDNSNYIPSDLPPVKFMTYNIEASGSNPDWIEVVKEENPDIIVFVETGDWDNTNDLLFDQHLNTLNNYFSGETPYVGNTGQNIGGSTSGEAIMSRFPLLSTVQLADVVLDDGTIFDVSHDFMIWELEVGFENVFVIGSHLKCCGGADNEEKRERATEGIINFMDSLGDVPILYAGDLNSFSPFDTGNLAPEGDLNTGPLTMMLDPLSPTFSQYASTQHTFTDVYRVLNPNTPGYTFGHQNPSLESRIDFIISNQHFIGDLINSTTGDTPTADSGSDHYNVDAFLAFTDTVTSTTASESSNSMTTSTSTHSSTSMITESSPSNTDTTPSNPTTTSQPQNSASGSQENDSVSPPVYLTILTLVGVFLFQKRKRDVS